MEPKLRNKFLSQFISFVLLLRYTLEPNQMIYFFISNFLAYKWGMQAFMIANDRMVNGRKDLLIVILKERINADRLPPDLRPYLSKFLN